MEKIQQIINFSFVQLFVIYFSQKRRFLRLTLLFFNYPFITNICVLKYSPESYVSKAVLELGSGTYIG